MEAYIVAGYRTAVGKAKKGSLKNTRPDDLAVEVIGHLLAAVPQLDPSRVEDLIVGNAVPEAEQGMQIGRMISVRALAKTTAGVTVNRYCGSGVETIAMATAKIKAGMADCIIAGGAESMSVMAMGGWRIVPNAKVGKENPNWYWGMGLTAEAVAKDFKVSREEQDKFALHSHEKALAAIKGGLFLIIRSMTVPGTIKSQGVIVNFSSIANISVSVSAAPDVDWVRLKIKNTTRVIMILGMVVRVMYLICENNSPPAIAGAKFVVSLSGESLSPK